MPQPTTAMPEKAAIHPGAARRGKAHDALTRPLVRSDEMLAGRVHEEPVALIVATIVRLDRLRTQTQGETRQGIEDVIADLEVAVDRLRRLVGRSPTIDPAAGCTARGDVQPRSADARTVSGPVPRPRSAGEQMNEPKRRTVAGQAPRTIVICDDHQDLRGAVTAALDDLDRFHVVGQAWDADSCLSQITDRRPDLLVLDVSLPGGGPALARAVKSANPSIKIVVFSGHDDGPTQRAMLAAGADEYVVKTGRLRQLIQTLDRLS